MGKIQSVRDLRVWQRAMDLAMGIFELTKSFPPDERYSMTDQIRRSSRSVAANLSEAWRKRRYEAAFVAKLSDAEAEAAETQTWLEFARRCRYTHDRDAVALESGYEELLGQIVHMATHPEDWIIGTNP